MSDLRGLGDRLDEIDRDLPRGWYDSGESCPECDAGSVLVGPMEWDTGHYPAVCSIRCGWSS